MGKGRSSVGVGVGVSVSVSVGGGISHPQSMKLVGGDCEHNSC